MLASTAFLLNLLEGDQEERIEKFKKTRECGIDEDYFWDDSDRKVFRFVVDYVRTFGVPPTLDIVKLETGMDLPPQVPEGPFEYWVRTIVSDFQTAILEHYGTRILGLAKHGNVEKALELTHALRSILSEAQLSRNVFTLGELMQQAVERHEKIAHGDMERGIPIGFPYIDKVTGGAQNGDIYLLLGESSSGKTYIMCRSALSAAEQGYKILMLSMEMPGLQIGRRALTLGASVDGMKFRLGMLSEFAMEKVREYVYNWTSREEDNFLLMEGKTSVRVGDIIECVNEYKPDVLYIDGVYMLRPSYGDSTQRWERIMEALEELKRFAMEAQIPIFATSQFGRGKTAKDGMAGVGYSYAMVQISSVCLGIEDVKDRQQTSAKEERSNVAYKHLVFLKGREGEKGKVLIKYDMDRATITEEAVVEYVPGFPPEDLA